MKVYGIQDNKSLVEVISKDEVIITMVQKGMTITKEELGIDSMDNYRVIAANQIPPGGGGTFRRSYIWPYVSQDNNSISIGLADDEGLNEGNVEIILLKIRN